MWVSSNSPTSALHASQAASAAVRWPRDRASAVSRSRNVASITSASAPRTGSIRLVISSVSPTTASLAPGGRTTVHHLGRNMAAIRQYHRLPSRERGALRPLRHAKCVEALRKQRASRLVLKPIPETRGISVRDRECFEAPTVLLQNRPLGDRSQPV